MKLSFKYIFNDKDTKLIKQLEGISMNTTMYIQEICHMHKVKVYCHASVSHYRERTYILHPFDSVKAITTNSHKNEVTTEFGVVLCDDEGVLRCWVGTTNDVGNILGEHFNRTVYHFVSASNLFDTGSASNSKSVSSIKMSYVLKRIKANWADILRRPLNKPIHAGIIKHILDVACDWKKTTIIYEQLSLSTKLQHELIKIFVNKKYDSVSSIYKEAYKDKLHEFDTMLEKVAKQKALHSLIVDKPLYVIGTYILGNYEAMADHDSMWLGEISVIAEEDKVRPTIKSSDVRLYYQENYKASPIYNKIKEKLLMYQLYLDGLDSEKFIRISPYHGFNSEWLEKDNFTYSEDLGVITLKDDSSDITTIWTIIFNVI